MSLNASSRLDKITEYLYLTGFEGVTLPNARKKLKELQIFHILTINNEEIPERFKEEPILRYAFLKASDSEDVDLIGSNALHSTLIAVDNKIALGHKVVIHCQMGVSRSATIVIAYLMMLNMWTYERAYKEVKKIRSEIKPNKSFKNQLEIFEKVGYYCEKNYIRYRPEYWEWTSKFIYSAIVPIESLENKIYIAKFNDVKTLTPERIRRLRSIKVTNVLGIAASKFTRSDRLNDVDYEIVHTYDGDGQDLLKTSVFDDAIAYMEETLKRKHSILVICCLSGYKLSALISILFIMKKYSKSIEEAMELVKKLCPLLKISESFYLQMSMYSEASFSCNIFKEFSKKFPKISRKFEKQIDDCINASGEDKELLSRYLFWLKKFHK